MLERVYRRLALYFIDKSGFDDDCGEDDRQSRSGAINQLRKLRSTVVFDSDDRDDYHHHVLAPNIDPSFNIRVYSVNGGKVIECETTNYTSNSGPNNGLIGSNAKSSRDTQVFIVPDGTDFVDELGKILMLHSLSN